MFKAIYLQIKRNMYFASLMITVSLYLLFLSSFAYAAHPLSTDDTGTQGKGKFQIEAQSEFVFDKTTDDGIETKTRAGQYQGVFTYGLLENLDIVLGIPYIWGKVKEDGVIVYDEKGISDLSIEAKWRFYEIEDGFSFAIKPNISVPTGDYKKGLGAGKATYGITFITTKEFKPFAVHLNLGYTFNDNKLDERKNIWRASVASEVEVIKPLRLVAEIGLQKNPDKLSKTNPAFATGGLIFSVAENFDLDFGIRAGLNKAEADMAVLAGIALRF
ncbi:MAG: transporter [Thermodesulfovibrionales bacterium]|nr:transporter [Thermodesulfovibrionales bacterium]